MKRKKQLIALILIFVMAFSCLPSMNALAVNYDFPATPFDSGDDISEGDTLTNSGTFNLEVYYYKAASNYEVNDFIKYDIVNSHDSYNILSATGANLEAPTGTEFEDWSVNYVYVSAGEPISVHLIANWKAAAPTANPVSGSTIEAGDTVTLSTITSGSAIYYTIDEVDPTTDSIEYTSPIAINSDITIKAIAYLAGSDYGISSVSTFTYTVSTPTSNGGGGGSSSQPIKKYTLTYNGNDNTSGTVPKEESCVKGAEVTVSDNKGILEKSGYEFDGWNTSDDGSGTAYVVGSTFTMGTVNTVLYAQWTKISKKLIYDKNKWEPASDDYYNVAYSTSDGKNTIVPTSYYVSEVDSILYETSVNGTYDAKRNFVGFDDIDNSYWASEFIWFLSA